MENILYKFDLNEIKENSLNIIGIDEAGRGPLAGPVVAAAVVLKEYNEELDSINDSKKLTEKKREKLFDVIQKYFEIGVGIVNADEIDEINILNATFLAMRKAIKDLNVDDKNYLILVDGNMLIRNYNGNQKSVVKGDAKSLSIAAASIIAKVTRDRIMIEIGKKYPEYKFEKHKGYGTKAHREAIFENGVLPIHRKTFLTKIFKRHQKELENK